MAALAGMSLEEMMAVLATVSRKFPINEAVTSLAMFLHALIEPQDDAAQAAKELGVDFGMERFQAEGLVAILQDLENATIGQASSLAGRVRGFRALGAILTDETKGVEDLKEMMNAGGAATEAYDKVQGTTTERLRRLKARVDELSLAVGERLVTAFDDASARIGPALEDAGKQFRALWNTVKELMPDLGDTLNLDFAGMIEAGIRAVPRFVASLITGLMQVYETITDLIDALTAQWSATVAAVKVMWTGSFPEIGAALGEALTSAITEALDALEKRFAGSFLGRVLAGTEATVAGIEGVFTTIGEAGIAVQEFLSGLTRPPANWRGTPTGAGPVPVPATPFSELATVVEPSLYERATEAYRAEIEKLKKENPKLAESWSEAFGKALQDAMRNAIKPETRPFAELLARLFFKIPASVRGRIGQFFDLMQKQYLAEQPPTKGRYLKDGPADPEIQKERAKREAELRSNIAEKVFAPRATFGVPMGMMRFPFALTGGGKTQEAWLAKIAQNTRETYMAIDKKGGLAP